MTEQNKNWEDKFTQEFVSDEGYVERQRDAAWQADAIKNFIRKQIKNARKEREEEILELIPGNLAPSVDGVYENKLHRTKHQTFADGYNQALSDLRHAITSDKE